MEEQFTRRNENVWSSTGIAIWTIIRWIIRLNCIGGFIVGLFFAFQYTMYVDSYMWSGFANCMIFLGIGIMMDLFGKAEAFRYEGVLEHPKMEIIITIDASEGYFFTPIWNWEAYVNGVLVPAINNQKKRPVPVQQPIPANLAHYFKRAECFVFPCNVGDHLLNIYIADRYSMVITLDNEIIMSNDRIHQNKLNEILG